MFLGPGLFQVSSRLFASFRVSKRDAIEPIFPLESAPHQYFSGAVAFPVEGPEISIPRQFSGSFLITNSIVTCFNWRHG